ncbi:hypothetical protein FRX31_027801, partial [Thalictrum thalictroides]
MALSKSTTMIPNTYHRKEVIDRIYSAKHGVEHVEMNLDSNGHLYLVDQNGSIIKNLIKRKNR